VIVVPKASLSQNLDFPNFNNPNWMPSGILFQQNPDYKHIDDFALLAFFCGALFLVKSKQQKPLMRMY
jgi:hypothetical protein